MKEASVGELQRKSAIISPVFEVDSIRVRVNRHIELYMQVLALESNKMRESLRCPFTLVVF